MVRSPATLIPLDTLPLVTRGMDLAAEILRAVSREGVSFQDGDIVVIAQKVVSKSEGRFVQLGEIEPSARARDIAGRTCKDARLVEVVLGEACEVLRTSPNVLIVEHKLGHVVANAGIDRSNVDAALANEETVLLLPSDPDRSAATLRAQLEDATQVRVGVVISDSFGRPWRLGTVGTAIGVAGVAAVIDRRGDLDLYGRELRHTEVGFADSIAAAAVLMMGEGNEGCPIVIVRDIKWTETGQTSRDALRPRSEDLFR